MFLFLHKIWKVTIYFWIVTCSGKILFQKFTEQLISPTFVGYEVENNQFSLEYLRFLSSILKLHMSSSDQNYIFEVPTKTN